MPYPCICTPCSGDGCISTPSCPSGNCLIVPSIVVNPSSSVLPCGSAGTVDLGALSDLSACTGTVNWGLISWDTDAFTSVSISSSGVLVFTTTNAIELDTFYTFTGRAACSDSILSQLFTIKIAVKNACLSVMCTGDQVCNPCDGTCIDPPDVELN